MLGWWGDGAWRTAIRTRLRPITIRHRIEIFFRLIMSVPAPLFGLYAFCPKANTIIGLSRALDLLGGDLQTLNHQIMPVMLAAKLLLKAARKASKSQSGRE